MRATDDDDLISARYVPTRHYHGVAGSFTAVRERDLEIAIELGVRQFVRHSIRGEWPAGWLQTRSRRVLDHLDAGGYVVVTFDADGHYIKEACAEVDSVGKMGMTIRPRRRAAGRRQ